MEYMDYAARPVSTPDSWECVELTLSHSVNMSLPFELKVELFARHFWKDDPPLGKPFQITVKSQEERESHAGLN